MRLSAPPTPTPRELGSVRRSEARSLRTERAVHTFAGRRGAVLYVCVAISLLGWIKGCCPNGEYLDCVVALDRSDCVSSVYWPFEGVATHNLLDVGNLAYERVILAGTRPVTISSAARTVHPSISHLRDVEQSGYSRQDVLPYGSVRSYNVREAALLCSLCNERCERFSQAFCDTLAFENQDALQRKPGAATRNGGDAVRI